MSNTNDKSFNYGDFYENNKQTILYSLGGIIILLAIIWLISLFKGNSNKGTKTKAVVTKEDLSSNQVIHHRAQEVVNKNNQEYTDKENEIVLSKNVEEEQRMRIVNSTRVGLMAGKSFPRTSKLH